VWVDADDDDGLANPIGLFPERELQQVGLGDADAFDGERLIASPLLERGREIDRAHAVGGHPEIGAGMVDDCRRCVHEIEQHTKLKAHQNRREGDAGERDHKTHAVMNEIAPGNQESQVGMPRRYRKASDISAVQADPFCRHDTLSPFEQ
jgi:hypothetical protein